jgi:hypothetical protein
MAVTWDRVLALLIAIAWAIGAGIDGGIGVGVMMFLVMLAPVGLICFADDIGRGPRDPGPKLTILGYYARRRWGGTGADRPTPPGMLVLAGWFLLVGLPIIIWLIVRRSGGPS